MMATEKRLLIDLQGVNMDEVDTSDCTDVEDILSAVITYLSEQPIVDAVEAVHGHWKYGTRAAVCSECGFERSLDDNFGAAIACPNCGATMDGDGNG